MSFTVYYGHDPALIPRLRDCSVLVFEPRGWSAQQLASLREPGGPRLLGYLSPFAWPQWAGPVRWWWGPSAEDRQWKARWHSLAWLGWRRKVAQLARTVRTTSHGIFLDNLDRLEADSRSLPYLRELLSGLRRDWPDAYLLGNRGFAHWDSLGPLLDGVLVENLADAAFGPSDRQWVEAQLGKASQMDLYALDYANRRDPAEAHRLRTLYPAMSYCCAPDESLQSLEPLGLAP